MEQLLLYLDREGIAYTVNYGTVTESVLLTVILLAAVFCFATAAYIFFRLAKECGDKEYYIGASFFALFATAFLCLVYMAWRIPGTPYSVTAELSDEQFFSIFRAGYKITPDALLEKLYTIRK